ncbi:MAG: ATP-binding protein, partial [Thermoguttaceae bacterium]|nr:ATP-binding protein [Thermoguttaceae bacterium]
LRKVNYALDRLYLNDSSLFVSDLRKKYYDDVNGSNGGGIPFSSEEREFIQKAAREKRTFATIVNPDHAPFSSLQNGVPVGIFAEIATILSERTGLNIQITFPPSNDLIWDKIQNNEYSLILDARDNYSYAEKLGLYLSTPYMPLFFSRVTRKSFSGTPKRIAVSKYSKTMQSDLSNFINDAELIEYPTFDQAIQAVVEGKVDVVYMNTLSAQLAVGADRSGLLTTEVLPGAKTDFCVGIRNIEDPMFVSIVLKAVRSLSSTDMQVLRQKYSNHASRALTVREWVTVHSMSIICCIALVLSLVAATLYVLLRNARTILRDNTIVSLLPLRYYVLARDERFVHIQNGVHNAKYVRELGVSNYDEVSATINRVFQTGKAQNANFILDGQYRTAFCSKLPKSLYGFETIAWISQDTSQLQNAKKQAESSAQRLELTLSSIGDGVFVTDEQGCLTMMNPVAEKMTGWKSEEACGHRVEDILVMKSYIDNTPVEPPIRSVLKTKRAVNLSNHTDLVSKDGQVMHIADSAAPIMDENGSVAGVIMVVRDVTEEYHRRSQLLRQAEQMKKSSELAAIAYFTCPLKTPSLGTHDFPESFWMCDAEGKPLHFKDWVYADDQDQFERSLDELISGRQDQVEISYRAQYKNRLRYFVMNIRKSKNPTTDVIEAVGVIHDVTVSKEYERQLERAVEDAQAASRAKSYFLSTMSHEIRTPLNSIVGFSEILLEPDIVQAERDEYLTAVQDAAYALLTLINGVLDLARLDAGKMNLNPVPTDVDKLFREIRNIFIQKSRLKGLQMDYNVPAGFPFLMLDTARIRQVLLNLVGNAVKFTHNGGVKVDAAFKPDKEGSSGRFVLTVRDTGIGIADEFRDKLFSEFAQQESIRGGSRQYEGTGLGLAICKKLIDVMGGTIDVESSVGKGSTFTVIIPNIAVSAGSEQKDSTPEKIEKEKKNELIKYQPDKPDKVVQYRILLVDDNPSNLLMLNALFQRKGLTTISAESGKEALTILEDHEFDLILTDLWMPEMNGAELAERIRQRVTEPNVAILAVTADLDASVNFDFSKFNGVMLKPLTVEKVQTIINILDNMKESDSITQTGQMIVNELIR